MDHTNANVQENVKNYQKFLLEDLGYAGVRLDMVKGYGGQYTKIYNEYTNVEFSVGEYWDSSYDNVKNWIDATGKTSAAFDFPCKYAINKAFSDNDMTELVWAANGTNDQPAGMIHFGYPRYAVTFVDNHDTYRDGSKFTGNVVAANAFILCSPGTPCVFLPHYQQYKSQIQALIKARNDVGVSNTSKVTVLKKQSDCYMAEVVGSKGKLVVKIGSAMVSPDGYTNDQIAASGNGYCVWTTTRQGGGGDDPQPQPQPTGRYVYYDNTKSNWNEVCCYYWIGSDNNTWPGVEMEKIGNVYRFELPEGVDGIIFNNNDKKKQTNNIENPAVGHVYYCEHDNWEKQDAIDNGALIPSKLYIIGHLEGGHWTDANVVEMTREGNIFTATGVVIEAPITPAAVAEAASGYFSLITSPDSSWSTEHRFGAAEHDAPINGEMPLYHFGKSVNAQSAYSWKAEAGKYDITADFDNMTLKAEKTQVTSIDDISASASDIAPVYYNLQGVEVVSPTSGLYIVVRDGKVSKEYIR